jgi:hypothetical protein
MGVFYLPAQFRQFTAVFQSAVVATRPQMPIRLDERRWDLLSPHVLGRRYKQPDPIARFGNSLRQSCPSKVSPVAIRSSAWFGSIPSRQAKLLVQMLFL